MNWKGAPGRPDICFPRRRFAIFVHGCFWHRCPKCNLGLPKTNTKFWKRKFELNVARDKEKERKLKAEGWKVMTIWECGLKFKFDKAVAQVLQQLKDIDSSLHKKKGLKP